MFCLDPSIFLLNIIFTFAYSVTLAYLPTSIFFVFCTSINHFVIKNTINKKSCVHVHVAMWTHSTHLLSAAPKIDNETLMYNIWCLDLFCQGVNINEVKQEAGLVQTFLRNKQFLDPCWLGSQTCCTPVVAHWCSLWEEVVR